MTAGVHYMEIVNRLAASGDHEAATRLREANDSVQAMYVQNKEQGETIMRYRQLERAMYDALSELQSAVSDCVVPDVEKYPGQIVAVDVRKKDLLNLRDQHNQARDVLRKWYPETHS